MKRLLPLSLSFFLATQLLLAQNQTDHLSLIYNFEGEDFDYAVKGMVGTNDSLYVISQTPNGQGIFFRIDENGQGYEVIWEFDATTYAPNSLIGNDTIIYGTTRFSESNGGSIFQYSLQDYNFEFIKNFAPEDVQEVQIKYVTDSVLWLSSQQSFVDNGSIAIINKDGTNFTKIYNDTNPTNGQNPVDFIFHNDSIYIACYNGGGVPYPDGVGSFVYSGSFIRIKSDGTGYENIIKGGDDKGTQPQSLFIREGKLIGQFAYSGSTAITGGQFFRSNLDGSEYDSLGALSDRALTKMLSTDSLIFGISFSEIFGISPFDGEIRIFEDLFTNSDFGYDVVSNPAYLNGYTFIATQQGGPDLGGTILRWTNEEPEEVNSGRIDQDPSQIDLNSLFTDPEGDEITFYFDYDEELVELTENNGTLIITSLTDSDTQTDVKITAYDGWAGYKSTVITIQLEGKEETATPLNVDESKSTLFYPNPVSDIIYLSEPVLQLQIFSLDGKLVFEKNVPSKQVNIEGLPSGVYTIKYLIDNETKSAKLIKE